MLVIACISLAVSVIALVFVVLIYSQTRETFRRMSAIAYTLPGAYDVERLIRDIEETGEFRGKVVCDAPKNTHIAYSMPFSELPRGKRMKNRIWRRIRILADCFSGNYEVPVQKAHKAIQESEVKR